MATRLSAALRAAIITALLPLSLCGMKEIVDESDDRVVYRLSWELDAAGDTVNFHLIHEGLRAGSWTGVGFNDRNSMVGTDLIKITVSPSGRVSVEDYSVSGYSGHQVTKDFPAGPIEVKSASWSDNTVRAEFSRPVSAPPAAKMRSLAEPLYWLFPFSGGEDFGVMRKHRRTPRVEKVELDFASAAAAGGGGVGSAAAPRATAAFGRTVQEPSETLTAAAGASAVSEHCPPTQVDDSRCGDFLRKHFDLTTPRDLECKRWVDYAEACCLALATPRRACVYV